MMHDLVSATGLRDLLDHNPVIGEKRAGPRRFWTCREEKVLRDTYPDGGVKACLPLLPGRSASSIYQRAQQIGVRPRLKMGGAQRQRWSTTPQIDAVITRVYQSAPTKNAINRLAATLARPRWWVSKRAVKLGLVAPRFKEPPWTENEIEIAARNAHKHPDVIAHILAKSGYKRTPTAIVLRLKRCGRVMGRDADPDHYTASALAKLFGVDCKGVRTWIAKGWLKAKKRGTERTPEQGGDEWWVHRRDIRRFVIENTAVVDLRKVEKFWFVEMLAGDRA